MNCMICMIYENNTNNIHTVTPHALLGFFPLVSPWKRLRTSASACEQAFKLLKACCLRTKTPPSDKR